MMKPATTTKDSTKALLAAGIVAGPLYMGVSLIQAVTRPAFDMTKHAFSLLLIGPGGWVQVVNFELTGLLLILTAMGWRRVLAGGRAAKWAPRLLTAFGLGMILAGFFRPDPALGFPAGTPADAMSISWHGGLHFLTASLGFLGFVFSCFVMARRFAADGQKGWTWYSYLTGVVFLAAFVGVASGSKGPATAAFISAVGLGFAWIVAVSAKLRQLA